MDPATIDTSTITVKDGSNNPVNGQVFYKALINGKSVVSFNPSVPLFISSSYTATVKGGAGGVTDLGGNPLASDQVWTFTTMTQPAPGGTHTFAGKWGSDGVGRGQFGEARGLAMDPQTHDIYVADQDDGEFSGAHTHIQKFGSDGHLITAFADDVIGIPVATAVDPNNGDVYVIAAVPAPFLNSRALVLSLPAGEELRALVLENSAMAVYSVRWM